jgi:HSP20 family protein
MAKDIVSPSRSQTSWPVRLLDLFNEEPFIRVEEVHEDGTLIIRAELPGVDPDKDVELVVDKGILTLHVERRENKEEKGNRYRHSEFRYGSFSRSLTLPAGATEDDVKATFENGILEVRIPVDGEKAETKKIKITKA